MYRSSCKGLLSELLPINYTTIKASGHGQILDRYFLLAHPLQEARGHRMISPGQENMPGLKEPAIGEGISQ
jgi:hypothetical protein